MADSWWDQLIQRMFAPPSNPSIGFGGLGSSPIAGLGMRENTGVKLPASQWKTSVQPELDKHEAAAQPAPAVPQPAQQKNPNARDDEDFRAGLSSALATQGQPSNLYGGGIPDGKVYTGSDHKQRPNGNFYRVPKLQTVQDVIADVNTWNEKKLKKFANLAVAAGLMKEPTIQHDAIESIYGALAIRSAKMYEKGVLLTPWQLLQRYASGEFAPKGTGSLGPITQTTVNKSINLSSPREANTLVNAILAERLGRDATKAEKKKFLEALNAAERKEPEVTKTTTTTTGGGTENVSTDSSSSSSGGVDVRAFADEWSMSHNKDEAGSYQALAQYMPAFFQALGAPV